MDSGIKMLVEAIAEAQSLATNGSPQCKGITSTPLRQSVPTAHSLETSITMSPAPVLETFRQEKLERMVMRRAEAIPVLIVAIMATLVLYQVTLIVQLNQTVNQVLI